MTNSEELAMINDIGPIVANSIREFFIQEQTIDLITKLKQEGVNTRNLEDYEDPILGVYGIREIDEEKEEDATLFYSRMKDRLKLSPVYCFLDAYYDPSTAYTRFYQKEHTEGHGRIVTAIDSEKVYYYAMDINDPKEQFAMSLEDMYLACESTIRFQYPKHPLMKKTRHEAMKKILYNQFVVIDYQKMFEDINKFSADIRRSSHIYDEIDHQFNPKVVPQSHLFGNLEWVCRSRGATVTLLQGYIDEFGNSAYQVPLEYLNQSLKLWKMEKALLVKLGMSFETTRQIAMANYLIKICNLERKAVTILRKIICDEM